MAADEADRIRRVYQQREARGLSDRYSIFSPAVLMTVQECERLFLSALQHARIDIAYADCLDVGCGTGGNLARWIAYGAEPGRTHGVDLLPDAISKAAARLPNCDVKVGDASKLPFEDQSMDVVTQWTVLSSILDPRIRQAVAAEMVRVCRPSGVIISYDFEVNPRNPDTRGVGRGELHRLFVGCRITVRRATLAPPLSRRLAPRSRHLAAAVGAFPILRSHLFAVINPSHSPGSSHP